jgi:predicted DNA-binding ribbon-helix-helix protein
MCDFFASADPILYESRSRTVRIHGVMTSIRLENFVWDTLATLAVEEGFTTNALIVQLHDEIMKSRGDVKNFSSFLRVTCLRFLRRKCDQLQDNQTVSLLVDPPALSLSLDSLKH